jgi:hypothetical protein
MTNIWKLKTLKGKPVRYAVLQQTTVVKYFSNKNECQRLLKHLRGGGGFSGEIPKYMLEKGP